MWENWANKLLPKALKSYLKSNKSPNLVTLLLWGLHSEWLGKMGAYDIGEVLNPQAQPLHTLDWFFVVVASVTRLGDLLDFRQLFKAFGYN